MGNVVDCCASRDKDVTDESSRRHHTIKHQATGSEFVYHHKGDIHHAYEIDAVVLGEGSFGKVAKGMHRASGIPRAVKIIDKRLLPREQQSKLRFEIDIMKQLDHPNIIRLFEDYRDANHVYLVMELCTGKDIFDRIIDAKDPDQPHVGKDPFTETAVAVIMKQVFAALSYIHSRDICHRDIKLENFLFSHPGSLEETNLKLIDFGVSCECADSAVLRSKVGTLTYVAPEVLNEYYGKSCDLWSGGVMLFILLSGSPPFGNEAQARTNILEGKYEFKDQDWSNISLDAKNLVSKLLESCPARRLTATEAIDDVWIKYTAPKAKKAPLNRSVMANFESFKNKNAFMKSILHFMARQLNDDEVDSLRQLFQSLDRDSDGTLTSAEIQEGMKEAGWEEMPLDLQKTLEMIDSNGNGTLEYTEFLAASLDKSKYRQDHQTRAAFDMFDKDGSGHISKQEIEHVLNAGGHIRITDEELTALFKDVDTSGDGHIDYEEFICMIEGAPVQTDV